MSGKVTILCGLIGSGKSTLSREIAEALGPDTLWLSEPDEQGGRNPYLADYYGDPKRWSLTMQVHLLGTRFRQHLQAQWRAMNTEDHSVLDSSYWQDTSFARLQLRMGLMDQREFDTYASLYHAMTAHVLLPNVCIRLRVSPETSAQRIAYRMERQTGRKCESVIDLQYLRDLDEEITHMTSVLQAQGVLVINVPWEADRKSSESRSDVVRDLARQIQDHTPANPFLDLHRRSS
jgi:deoxyadenosine/deoxycytidine kinase